MKKIINAILKGEKLKKHINSYRFNILAGLINAGKSVLLIILVSRTNGLNDAGILTIAFAIANLMLYIGKFGGRSLQVTDTNEKNSFPIYFYSRIITIILMLLISSTWLVYSTNAYGYSVKKVMVIFSLCIIYASESMEDVFAGYYQQQGRLDIASRLFVYRWIIILTTFIGILVFQKNLILASCISAVVSIVIVAISVVCTIGEFYTDIWKFNKEKVMRLLYNCFPIFLSNFLLIYTLNAPKYAIDKYLSERIQACFGFVAMPVFVMGLLSSFFYQPILLKMSLQWNQGKYKEFILNVRKQYAIILGINIICFLGAYVIGIPALSVIYGVELADFKSELLLLVISGGVLAFSNYIMLLLTIMREQSKLLIGHAIVATLAFFFMGGVVKYHGIFGAAEFNLVLMVLLSVILQILFTSEYRKKAK